MNNQKSVVTQGLYFNLSRRIAVINYGNQYFSDIFSLMNSKELFTVISLFLESKKHNEGPDFENLKPEEYIEVIKKIMCNEFDVYQEYQQTEILQSIEDLYSFYRSFLRISVLNLHESDVVAKNFISIDNQFNNLVIHLYRSIEEKLQGHVNQTYREVSAASSACILTQSHEWPIPKGYEALQSIRFIDTLLLRPPMMMTTPSNKRAGIFSPMSKNPLQNFSPKKGEWYCFPAKIGESLAYIYFHRDYFVSGISLANLFEVADSSIIVGRKPNLILLFGNPNNPDQDSHYYHDEVNDIWIGTVPYNDQTTYFGYMKKMCLTLHNLQMINEGKLPIHGSMVKIKFANGKAKTVVFFGDSGAGKSESIEALQEVADDQIVRMETIFDDMGSFAIEGDQLYAQGTEIGAFVRLDDLSSAVAFNNMDRGIYLNPAQKNARVIIPADSYENIIAHHPIDMFIYANNYDDQVGVHRFLDKKTAQDTFIAGKRKALGTTDETGMSTTFFANPFGPVQEEKRTRPIIEAVFNKLFENDVYVGEIYTHLGNDKSRTSLQKSAQELLKILMQS